MFVLFWSSESSMVMGTWLDFIYSGYMFFFFNQWYFQNIAKENAWMYNPVYKSVEM